VARLDADVRVHAGETIHVVVAPSRVHLFDPETGVSLRC
jgi:hypothetical protein